MRSKFRYIGLFFFLLLICTKVEALSVSQNDVTMEAGTNKQLELYANTDVEVKRVEFTLVFSTYDIPANFSVDGKYYDENPNGIAHYVVMNTPASGKVLLGKVDISTKAYPSETVGSISIHSAKAITVNDETIYLNSQTINVKIGTPPAEEPTTTKAVEKDKNLLDKIESKLVKIELKKDVFEYSVNVSKDVTELDLKPIAKDEKTKIDITTQKIDEIKDNKITITAKLDDVEQKYVILLKTKLDVEVDKEEFKEDNSYKGKWIVLSILLGVILVVSLLLTKRK